MDVLIQFVFLRKLSWRKPRANQKHRCNPVCFRRTNETIEAGIRVGQFSGNKKESNYVNLSCELLTIHPAGDGAFLLSTQAAWPFLSIILQLQSSQQPTRSSFSSLSPMSNDSPLYAYSGSFRSFCPANGTYCRNKSQRRFIKTSQ